MIRSTGQGGCRNRPRLLSLNTAVGDRRESQRHAGPWNAALIVGTGKIDIELSELSETGAKISPLKYMPESAHRIEIEGLDLEIGFQVINGNPSEGPVIEFDHTQTSREDLRSYILDQTSENQNQLAVA
ncbi:hypothetical protein [Kiloniella sp.]|uniref:hypothetical protein n=1 Tax=Kiloniella sp. TaxID=1938587 RepID=UPI003B0241B6